SQRGAGATHRQRDGAHSLGDVGDGRAQHGDGGARWATAESAQPRGQAIAVTTAYKLLALDLDGTIIDARLNLDPRDVEALAGIPGWSARWSVTSTRRWDRQRRSS